MLPSDWEIIIFLHFFKIEHWRRKKVAAGFYLRDFKERRPGSQVCDSCLKSETLSSRSVSLCVFWSPVSRVCKRGWSAPVSWKLEWPLLSWRLLQKLTKRLDFFRAKNVVKKETVKRKARMHVALRVVCQVMVDHFHRMWKNGLLYRLSDNFNSKRSLVKGFRSISSFSVTSLGSLPMFRMI